MENLILWRHADAEIQRVNGNDIDRALTKRGRKDAAKMAKWLHQYLPANTVVFCSPARRCIETVAALQKLNADNIQREVKVVEFLSVDSTVEAMAKKLTDTDSSKTLLIIGHQPNLGLLIAKLLGMQESACVVKKGAVWWLRQRNIAGVSDVAAQTYLFAVQHPDYLPN
jgi:phosphohistidine phosphatase